MMQLQAERIPEHCLSSVSQRLLCGTRMRGTECPVLADSRQSAFDAKPSDALPESNGMDSTAAPTRL